MDITSQDREKKCIQAVNIALAANVLLAIAKSGVGITAHSPALLADGINSFSDVAYSVLVSAFVRRAGKPPDHEHPYGHRQLESIGAVVVGAFVVTTAIAIFWNSVNVVYDLWIGKASYEGASAGALVVAILTIAIKLVLTSYTQRIGQETHNAAIMALSRDHRNDIFSATAAAAGIALGMMGYVWVDPLAGALVAMFIFQTGIAIVRDSIDDLMDTVPGKTLGRQITALLITLPGVEQVEEIQAHRFGPYLVINVTVGVDGSLTVAEGDRIASQVENTLHRQIELVRRVHVHYHPARSQHLIQQECAD